jgi:uroporphyrinogen decarboxylase
MGNDTFLKACRREATDYTPIWLMRQAGRYMKEYMAIRSKHTFLEMCRTPELACEITLQPIRRFEFDAAIIFADILLPLEGMGIKLEFAKNEGPVIHNPVRTRGAIDAIRIIEPAEDVPYLIEAIKLVKVELKGKVPYPGKLHYRGRRLQELHTHKGPYVRGSRILAQAHGKDNRGPYSIPEGSDKCRGRGGAGF